MKVAEGGTRTYTAELSSKPTGTVTVTIAKASGGDQHLTVGGGLDLELEGRRRERAHAAHGAALHEAALSGSLRW